MDRGELIIEGNRESLRKERSRGDWFRGESREV